MENMINYWTLFLTGLFTGGLTCLAVQGGLLATSLAQRSVHHDEKTDKGTRALPLIVFLGAKLVAYTIFGVLLGWLGSLVQVSLGTQVIMQVLVGIFMFGTALNILEVHPIFRYFALQPPRFLTSRLRHVSKSAQYFAPALLGGMTIFIPCGTTQAMMALAVGSGNALVGGMILFSFILGTIPVFFILGYYATRLDERMHRLFLKVTAVILIVLACVTLRNSLALSGVNLSSASTQSNTVDQPVTDATVTFLQTSYSPQKITVSTGAKVTLHLNNQSGSGCIQAFTIPTFGIQKIVPVGTRAVVTFTAPQKPQQIEFMCSMGMYRGVIDVI